MFLREIGRVYNTEEHIEGYLQSCRRHVAYLDAYMNDHAISAFQKGNFNDSSMPNTTKRRHISRGENTQHNKRFDADAGVDIRRHSRRCMQ